jgi:hypothetical protein
MNRQTDVYSYVQIDRHVVLLTDKQSCSFMNRQTDMLSYRQTNIHVVIWTDRQTCGLMNNRCEILQKNFKQRFLKNNI